MMERLTKRIDGGIQVHHTKYMLPNDITRSVLGAIVHRLAAYEDTGLTPPQVAALQTENEKLKAVIFGSGASSMLMEEEIDALRTKLATAEAERDSYKHRASKIIAIDFDGCICEDEYPCVGKPRWWVIKEAIRRRESGDKLILNTCRTGERLIEAIKWCRANGLVFDGINANLPECIEKYGGDCRKICADEYWDDRNVLV